MSIIGVTGVPIPWTINQLQLKLEKFIKGPFEALNFAKGRGGKNAYLRLSETLDPLGVIENLNRLKVAKGVKIYAFMPKKVPDFPLPKSHVKKVKAAIGPPQPPEQTLIPTHHELLSELQYKYLGLYSLSAKHGHKLLKTISKTVFERLNHIMETNIDYAKTSFVLSKSYRKSYPHFADFQLVLSTLHGAQDAAGAQRTQLLEQDLIDGGPEIEDIPFEKVQKTCHKYTDKIQQKVVEHINGLNSEPSSSMPTPEELAQCRVRTELKKVAPYMGHMLRQVVTANFVNTKQRGPNKYVRIRIYGEPYLPTRDFLEPILRPIDARRIVRSDHIFNMVAFTTTYGHLPKLMERDGTELGGAKLIIRKSEMKVFKAPPEFFLNLMKKTKVDDQYHDIPEPEMNEEDMEDWTEEL